MDISYVLVVEYDSRAPAGTRPFSTLAQSGSDHFGIVNAWGKPDRERSPIQIITAHLF